MNHVIPWFINSSTQPYGMVGEKISIPSIPSSSMMYSASLEVKSITWVVMTEIEPFTSKQW